jgi:predicted DNA binding CopG/RHH family protein
MAERWSEKCSDQALRRVRARATFKRDQRVNIRISGKDLDALKKRALEEGLPYQTLISSVLHKFVSGRLKSDGSRGADGEGVVD